MVFGAPSFFAGLIAIEGPVATSMRKPMMVSYTEPICSTSRVR